VLRATVASDIAPLHERVFSDAAVIRFVFSGSPFTAAESESFMRERFNFSGADVGLSTLEERGSGEVVGFAGLIACAALGREDLEFGFVLARGAWGKGYATEIGRAQIDFGFHHLRRARLLALADPANTLSINVLAKLGMRHEADATIEGRGHRGVYCVETDLSRKPVADGVAPPGSA
jgi:RimJ/RimL family protein N-acetyltransferase